MQRYTSATSRDLRIGIPYTNFYHVYILILGMPFKFQVHNKVRTVGNQSGVTLTSQFQGWAKYDALESGKNRALQSLNTLEQ